MKSNGKVNGDGKSHNALTHPFLTMLGEMFADNDLVRLRAQIIKCRVAKKVDGASANFLENTPLKTVLKERHGKDVFVGTALRTDVIRDIIKGKRLPIVTEHEDEVLQLARDFGLTGKEREKFLKSGYDYAQRRVEPKKEPERPVRQDFVWRIKNPAVVKDRMLPAFFEKEVFPVRGMRCGRVFIIKPGTPLSKKENLSYNKLQHEMGVDQYFIQFLTGKQKGHAEIEGKQLRLQELLEQLLIPPGDPLYEQGMRALKHDIALINRPLTLLGRSGRG